MRVFYITPDPEDWTWITFTGEARFNDYGVVLLPDDGATWSPYGEGQDNPHETTDLVPWHRVIQVEGYPR